MNSVTHLLMSWAVAESARLGRRDRILVTLAGILPDIDGLGIVAEVATAESATPLGWWTEYHHVLGHNIGFGLAIVAAVAALSTRRAAATVLALAAFHLHLLGDLVGARGPDGYQWPIPYLLPFSDRWQLSWEGQWALNAWPNLLLSLLLLDLTFFLAWRRGYSPLGIFSTRADNAFVAALRSRFGKPPAVAG